jgi:hypothetical protein
VYVVGSFENLVGTKPLIKPYTAALAAIRSLHVTNIAVFCPEGQEQAIRSHWCDAIDCLETVETVTIDLEEDMGMEDQEATVQKLVALKQTMGVQCAAIDYVGQSAFSPAALLALSTKTGLPVLDMQVLALSMLLELFPVPSDDDDGGGGAMGEAGAEENDSDAGAGSVQVLESGSWKGEGAQVKFHCHYCPARLIS